MKKITTLIFLFVSILTLQAQSKSFAIKGGLAQSWLRGKELNADSFERRNGFYIGAFMDVILTEKRNVTIQPEVIFSTEGGTIFKKNSENDHSYEIDIHSNVLRIPVLVKIMPLPKFSIEGGPQITYRFSAKSIDFSNVSIKSTHNAMDFGIDLGATYHFSMPFKPAFFIQVRWTNNFLKMLDTSKIDSRIDLSEGNILRSSIGQIGVGYRF
ncbi:hypothetical protein CAPN010_09100 [Capnocytophaga cynodegmi]|uniref:porin family protein n=1 Tax=Capnocytophaga cynodegmi TaxID=28189 RepID=UPI001EE17FDE|nr:porin family protein [Capnocytophaga cynodegmi]GJQ06752.1 hypothetical protein CAPN010_09100 [Capnocytophaga cynodegmi]